MTTPERISRRQALRRVGALLGGLVSAPTIAGVMGGCTRESGPEWSPDALTAAQNEMVDAISEIIIPATDTPGARAANVNRFVDAMVGESYLPEDRERFLRGLDHLDARCQDEHGASFIDLDAPQQRSLVGELDDNAFGPGAPAFDPDAPPFFRMMKELTIVGYYTSKIGATEELKLNIVPGRHEGDVPYDEIGRAWAQ